MVSRKNESHQETMENSNIRQFKKVLRKKLQRVEIGCVYIYIPYMAQAHHDVPPPSRTMYAELPEERNKELILADPLPD